ncbi:2-dehydro-3-deoxygalactonokinase [Oricola thermophila]|uniref:2-dehydro-3-deoxygalactonokinase n=1 Tax=Oricola thermophila TaxID=2742145 RepID=A0A6N1VH97_9HYPH|nr:2-dehydro-3-deoxygalactonokinase [Oricola thermophila]QKV18529.1 2-dehydro-3-deoxygalactonokinase [Oricola thermophila]
MTRAIAPSLVAVDWGTSHLRIWLLGDDGSVVAEHGSDEGMSTTPREGFHTVLEAHLAALAVPLDVPVMMCGMVGSRQGWAEARYLALPATLADIAGGAVRIPDLPRDIFIMPGLCKPDERYPDVMRGEETQLLGLHRISPVAGDRIACMPGTHSKWVHMKDGSVTDFVTFMTGDAFAALSSHSVLRHSMADAPVDSASPVFREAVRMSLDCPADILARLFSIRPASLLEDLDPVHAKERLSGFLIGEEIAGARARLSLPAEIDIIGGEALSALYEAALSEAGITCRIHDGKELAIAGLAGAANAMPDGAAAG